MLLPRRLVVESPRVYKDVSYTCCNRTPVQYVEQLAQSEARSGFARTVYATRTVPTREYRTASRVA